MKKLATIALIIALTGVTANASLLNDRVFLTFTAEPVTMAELNDGGLTVPPIVTDPTTLTRYTFFLNDKPGDEQHAFWGTIIDFTSPDGSGIYNLKAFGGFVDVNFEDEATNYHGNLYSKFVDSWIFNDILDPTRSFGFMGSGIPELINGPHDDFMPVVSIGVGGKSVAMPSGIPFVQLISDGNIEWDGEVARGSQAAGAPVAGGTGDDGPDPTCDAHRNQPDPNRYEIHAGGEGKIGPGGRYGFHLRGSYDPDGGPDPTEIHWSLAGPGVGNGTDFEEILSAMGDLDPIITFEELRVMGVQSDVDYLLLLDVDGTTSEGELNIPEPTTMGLMLLGSFALISRKRRG